MLLICNENTKSTRRVSWRADLATVDPDAWKCPVNKATSLGCHRNGMPELSLISRGRVNPGTHCRGAARQNLHVPCGELTNLNKTKRAYAEMCAGQAARRGHSQMQIFLGLLFGITLAGAGAAAQTSNLIDDGEFKDRQACMYSELDRMIERQGTSETFLRDIAKAATERCSQKVRDRLMRGSPTVAHGEELARFDQRQAELRALSIARELMDKRVK